jgi:hypothetical protein
MEPSGPDASERTESFGSSLLFELKIARIGTGAANANRGLRLTAMLEARINLPTKDRALVSLSIMRNLLPYRSSVGGSALTPFASIAPMHLQHPTAARAAAESEQLW